jgi:hypothetical protein
VVSQAPSIASSGQQQQVAQALGQARLVMTSNGRAGQVTTAGPGQQILLQHSSGTPYVLAPQSMGSNAQRQR